MPIKEQLENFTGNLVYNPDAVPPDFDIGFKKKNINKYLLI